MASHPRVSSTISCLCKPLICCYGTLPINTLEKSEGKLPGSPFAKLFLSSIELIFTYFQGLVLSVDIYIFNRCEKMIKMDLRFFF